MVDYQQAPQAVPQPPQQQPPQYAPPTYAAPPQPYPPQPYPQQPYAQPPQQPYPPQSYAPPPEAPLPAVAPAKAPLPGWAIALLVAGVLGLGGYIVVDKIAPSMRGGNQEPAAEEPLAKSATPGRQAAPAGADDQTKYLQITGLRITETNRKPQISLVVVNHASAQLVDVDATVLVHTTKDAPGAEPLAKLQLKLANIGANEVRDVTMPFPTKLRAYELPDWQFLTAELAPIK